MPLVKAGGPVIGNPGKLGKPGREGATFRKIPAEPVVTMTMILPVSWVFPTHQPRMSPTVTASLNTWIARTLAVVVATAAASAWTPARAAETATASAIEPALAVDPDTGEQTAEPVAFDEGLVLDTDSVIPEMDMPVVEEVASAPLLDAGMPGSVIRESVISEAIVPESVMADGAVVEPPRIMDVTNPDFGGMLLDESALEEMPFEASSGRWFWNGGWYVGGESLWMERSRNNRDIIAADIVTGTVTYTTFAQPFNVAPGARATIGKSLGRDYLDRDRFVEFIYYGGMSYESLDGWNGVGGNTLWTPLFYGAPGFNAAGRYTTNFNSDFNSWEWNYKLRRRLGRDQLVMSPNGSWTRHAERGWLPALITGIRLANVNEDWQLISDRPGVSTDDFYGQYTINTGNWLLGLNIGGELISQNEFYYWGLRGRAAPALSFASASQEAYGINRTGQPQGQTSDTPYTFSDSITRTGAGFIGDLTLLAGWQINPNFSLQVGYDFLWVAGMATATRQFNLDNRDNYAIDVGGQTFYNGVSFGFNGSW